MKGRYNGCRMTIYGTILPGAASVARSAVLGKVLTEYPTWSKYKIRVLLKREGIEVSASTIGRILKRRNLINKKLSKKRRKAALRPKARFPRGLKISEPGDMIQMDTKHIILTGGKSFTSLLLLMF